VPVVVRIGPGVDLGWVIAAVGVGLDVVGWYQVSGQPTEAQQLPYLASATIPGAALIVAGAILIAGRRNVQSRAGTRTMYASDGAVSRAGLWALPDGSYVHRGDCPLLDGKPEAFEVTGATGAGSGDDTPDAPTRPCPICEPDLVPAA
jgi:hypothetical protein